MDGFITIVDDGMDDWEDEPHDSNRYSIFTQNIMLAEKVSRRQHLSPRGSKLREDDERSFHSAESRPASIIVRADSPTIPEEDTPTTASTTNLGYVARPTSSTTPANIGRLRTGSRRARRTSQSSSGDWTWRPSIPQRVSSMGTRRRQVAVPGRPDLATFHRRSCQLFSSLDTTLSGTTAGRACDTGSPDGSYASTSPSLASSISTEGTSITDEHWYTTPAFSSFHLELQVPGQALQHGQLHSPNFGDFMGEINHTPRIGVRRSSSQLSPNITSTEAMFWTSDATRKAEYAKIDAAHSGFRGFVKRLLPRSWGWAHGKRRNFHPVSPSLAQDETIPNDNDSVRRYRLSIASATQEAIRGVEEHGISGMNTPMRCKTPPPANDSAKLDVNSCSPALTVAVASKQIKTSPVDKVLAKVRSSDALTKLFRSQAGKIGKAERRAKTLSREFGF